MVKHVARGPISRATSLYAVFARGKFTRDSARDGNKGIHMLLPKRVYDT